jgi:hypothetical protein
MFSPLHLFFFLDPPSDRWRGQRTMTPVRRHPADIPQPPGPSGEKSMLAAGDAPAPAPLPAAALCRRVTCLQLYLPRLPRVRTTSLPMPTKLDQPGAERGGAAISWRGLVRPGAPIATKQALVYRFWFNH